MYNTMEPSPVEELALLDLERSNKGASKQRRDQINGEIATMRDLLPLAESARQRLSQLQIMSLSCVYIRKCSVLKKLLQSAQDFSETKVKLDESCDFSEALTGFLLVTTRDGKLVYISENVNEYLGHSMVDMKTQGDSLFDIVDKRDHNTVQAQLIHGGDRNISFFCRMNMSRTLKRQAGFGDVKVMHVRGRFTAISDSDSDSGPDQQVFLSVCTPLITPDIKESLILNNTTIFKSVHRLDMSFIEITQNGEFYLGASNDDIANKSWYNFIHPDDIQEARDKHVQLLKSRHEMGCMVTVRMLGANGDSIWVNLVMQVRQSTTNNCDDPVVVCINQVISEQEAHQFKIQGQLFAMYVSRTPDLFFGPQYGGAMVPSIQGNFAMQHAPGFFNPPGYEQVVQPLDCPVMDPGTSPGQFINMRCVGDSSELILREGHNNTLRALKRKLQDNFKLSCRPAKATKFFPDNSAESSNQFHNNSSNTPTSYDVTNIYRNVLDSVPVANSPIAMSQGSVHAYQMNSHVAVLSGKENCLTINTDTSPSSCISNIREPTPKTRHGIIISSEQVVPDIRVPESYLTPEPSPASSPQPHTNQLSSVDTGLIDPRMLTQKLEKLKEMSLGTAIVKRVKTKAKQLPVIDATYVETFFEDIGLCMSDNESGDFLGKKQDKRNESLIIPKLERTDCRVNEIDQSKDMYMMELNDMDDFFLSLDSFGEIPSSPESLEMCQSSTQTVTSDLKQETFVLSPESITDFDSCDDDLVPHSVVRCPPDITLNIALVDKNTSHDPSKEFSDIPLEVEDELFQLKQLLSSLTPRGVADIQEETR